MPKIWVANFSGHRYHLASEVVPDAQYENLTVGNVNPTLVDRLSFLMAERIAKEASEEDYLLLSGSPVVNAIAAALWITAFGVVNLLIWDAKKDRYFQQKITANNIGKLLDAHTNQTGSN